LEYQATDRFDSLVLNPSFEFIMKISTLVAILSSSVATAAAAKVDNWVVSFYETEECNGNNPFDFGDEVPYPSCTKIDHSDTETYKSLKVGPNTGQWALYFYEEDDCSGQAHYNVYNSCLIREAPHYKSFKVSFQLST
jgi:hypothetical protein